MVGCDGGRLRCVRTQIVRIIINKTEEGRGGESSKIHRVTKVEISTQQGACLEWAWARVVLGLGTTEQP